MNQYSRTRLPKMRDLKERLKAEQKILMRLTPIQAWRAKRKSDGLIPSEKAVEREKELSTEAAKRRANIQALQGEYSLVQMNKAGSQFFEYHPNKGMNRRQARLFRKERVKAQNRITNRVVK